MTSRVFARDWVLHQVQDVRPSIEPLNEHLTQDLNGCASFWASHGYCNAFIASKVSKIFTACKMFARHPYSMPTGNGAIYGVKCEFDRLPILFGL